MKNKAGFEVHSVDMMHKQPFFHENDEMYFSVAAVAWQPVEIKAGYSKCQHLETVCAKCLDQWSTDYWVTYIDATGERLGINDVPGYRNLRTKRDSNKEA